MLPPAGGGPKHRLFISGTLMTAVPVTGVLGVSLPPSGASRRLAYLLLLLRQVRGVVLAWMGAVSVHRFPSQGQLVRTPFSLGYLQVATRGSHLLCTWRPEGATSSSLSHALDVLVVGPSFAGIVTAFSDANMMVVGDIYPVVTSRGCILHTLSWVCMCEGWWRPRGSHLLCTSVSSGGSRRGPKDL